MACEKIVAATEDCFRKWQVGGSIERPRPPNVARQINQRVRARVIPTVARQHSHAGKEFVLRQTKAFGHPGGLQGRQVEPADGQSAFKASSPFAAKGAVPVVEDPGAGPAQGCVT